MKKVLAGLFFVALCCASKAQFIKPVALAQPLNGHYYYLAVDNTGALATSGTGATTGDSTYVQPFAAMGMGPAGNFVYLSVDVNGVLQTNGAGGGTAPTATNIKSALQGQTGCNTAGYVYSVQSNTCLAPGTPTASSIASAIQTQTGCNTAGYIWQPQSNTCVANTAPAATNSTLGTVGGLASGQSASTVLQFLDATSSIQIQLNNKLSSSSAPTGTIVGTTDTQTLTNKTVDGVTPTTMGYVDPTSSIQTQLGTKAPLASPAFTGTPTVPTASVNDNSTKASSTAYADRAASNAQAAAIAASDAAGAATTAQSTAETYSTNPTNWVAGTVPSTVVGTTGTVGESDTKLATNQQVANVVVPSLVATGVAGTAGSTTVYMPPCCATSLMNANEGTRIVAFPRSGVISHLWVCIQGTQGNGALTFTYRVGTTAYTASSSTMANTSLTVTFPTSATAQCIEDSTDSFNYTAGYPIDVAITNASTATSAAFPIVQAEFTVAH
jgi:hypothetical protein